MRCSEPGHRAPVANVTPRRPVPDGREGSRLHFNSFGSGIHPQSAPAEVEVNHIPMEKMLVSYGFQCAEIHMLRLWCAPERRERREWWPWSIRRP
jgi:hypothetical protein